MAANVSNAAGDIDPRPQARPPAIELVDVSKIYPGVRAVDGVSFDAVPGEIHALLGENGAGKSTLMKMMMGAIAPDSGVIRVEGEEVTLGSPRKARRKHGIKMIPQEVELCGQLTVGRNVLLGVEGMVVRRESTSSAETARIRELFEIVGSRVSPARRAHELSVPEMRLTQIAHALGAPGNLILCDEPTAVLSEQDAESLLERLMAIRDEGRAAVVYVSHRLNEVLQIADRITVLRSGRNVGTFTPDEVDRERLIDLMTKTGGNGTKRKARAELELATPRMKGKLEVRGLAFGRKFQDVSLTVEAGQIVGIAGVEGSGHGALLDAIAGRYAYESGTLVMDGSELRPGSTAAASRAGIGLVPADRREAGIAGKLALRENIALPLTGSLSRFGVRRRRAERVAARTFIDALDIRGAGPSALAAGLSGGNQQKLALARLLQGRPRILLLDEPTQGIDVRAKSEIRDLVNRLASDEGLGVLVASSEFDDLLGFADVIHVMRLGRLVATIDGGEATYGGLLREALP
jgi:monosaccharide-transporting ATPase